MLADDLTPISVYRALAQERPGTFLLESAEQGKWSRYSFVGVDSAAMLTERGRTGPWVGRPAGGCRSSGNPVEVLRDTVAALATPARSGAAPRSPRAWSATSPTTRSAAGSGCPTTTPTSCGLPELGMLLATDVAVVDHMQGTVTLIANAINFDDTAARVDEAYADAVARLDRMTADLARPPDPWRRHGRSPTPSPRSGPGRARRLHGRGRTVPRAHPRR